MIRSRKIEEIDADLIKIFANDNLLVEESRKSRLNSEDKALVMKLAFDNLCNYYPSDKQSEFFRKVVYQMNFDNELLHRLFCVMNSILVELYHVPDKSTRLEEARSDLSNLFELMFFLGQSDSDGFLHDETKGGKYHPNHEPRTYF